MVIQIFNALSYSVILFLLSSGLCLMFGLMKIVNLAHGSLYMLAGYVGFSIAKATDSFALALLGGMACTALISLAMERGLLRFLHKHDMEQLLVTFGLIFIFQNLARNIWKGHTCFVAEPDFLAGAVQLFGITYPMYRLVLILIGFAVATGLWLLEEKTKIGAIIRAGVDDAEMVEGMGKNVKLIFTLVFALGGALAGLAGVLGSVLTGAFLGVGLTVLILSLLVIVIGGMGSLKGAMLGSLLIGFADVFGKVYLPHFAYFIVYGLMVIVLVIKPTGLLGQDE